MKEQPACERVDGCNTAGICTERQECRSAWRKNRKRKERLFGTNDASRIKDNGAIVRKLLRDSCCRVCKRAASEGHHIVFKSGGGDDVEDNIAPLCNFCHTVLHGLPCLEQVDVATAIGDSLREEEIDYVLDRLGENEGRGYLQRRYNLDVETWRRKRAS